MKFWKFLLGVGSVVLASIGTLLFQPTVFCEITIPVAAKLAGWKARAVSAQLTAFGRLEIEGLEAVDEKKSRIAMDSAKVEFDPVKLVTARPEILRADFKFALLDLELAPGPKEKRRAVPISIPFSLREASVEVVEGRLRTETGAWILKSAHASAEGWDGTTPREIRLQLGHLDWNGPGQQELATITQATARKSRGPTGGDVWEVKLTTDVSSVVDLPPWNLVSPCQLVLEGKAVRTSPGDWQVEGLQAVWQGVGGIRLAAKIGGTYAPSGAWDAGLKLEPTELKLAGIFLQSRGIENVAGLVAGTVKLAGGAKRPLGVYVDLNGQGVQLAAGGGATWPAQTAALGISSQAEWREKERVLEVKTLAVNLGQANQPADFQLSLDRPAQIPLAGQASGGAAEGASLQWAARGLELAAVAPLLIAPDRLKVEGGKLSGTGQAKFENEKVGIRGRLESQALTAEGSWVQGKLAIQSATLDFAGFWERPSRVHLESAQLKASWEGGGAEDLAISAKLEWDWTRKEGFVAGDLSTGLAGLGSAWAGAKFWPAEGQAQVHAEFSGNFTEKGSGLVSMTLDGMRWPGEKGAPWGGKLSSEVQALQGTWTLPEVSLQAGRAGDSLLDAKGLALWKPAQNLGRVKVELARAESAFVVPLLKNFTPDWQWTEASGKGSFEFTRENRHDLVKADLEAAVTVETGTPQRPRPVDFSSVQGQVHASWPSGAEGQLAIENLALVAKHRNGTEAVRVSLDAPLLLKKNGPGQWEPAGTQASSGMIQFGGWPMGIVAPLVLPEAKESSMAGTLSGFLRVQSDPQKRTLAAQLDLTSPDLSVELPNVRWPENQVSLQADLALDAEGTLAIQQVMVGSRQAGQEWLELSATQASPQGMAVTGKVDLGTLGQNVPAVAPYVRSGTWLLKANVSEPKAGVRKIGFSTEAEGLTLGLPEIGAIPSLQAKILGRADWGKDGLASLDDLDLTVDGPGGKLLIGKLDAKLGGAVAWESARIPEGWVAILARPWLSANRWADGDLVLEEGFWQPEEHGASGEIDVLVVRANLSDPSVSTPVSLRLDGAWDYDSRTETFSLKNTSVRFVEFVSRPAGEQMMLLPAVQIPSLQAGPDRFRLQIAGGVLDLRGLLSQWRVWQSPPPPAGRPTPARSFFISADLDQLLLPQFKLGPVQLEDFQVRPDGMQCKSLDLRVLGRPGVLSGSIQPNRADPRQNRILLQAENLPLGALAGWVDHSGDLDGTVNGELEILGNQGGWKGFVETGTGSLWIQITQASLQNIASLRTSLLEEAGRALGSSTLIPTSELNSLALVCTLQKSQVAISKFQITGSALELGLAGNIDLASHQLNLKGPLGLTRDAIQSCGVLQGLVLDDKFANPSDYYVKMPGDLEVTGSWDRPKVDFDKLKAAWRGALNLGLGILQGTGDAAGGAAGGAAGAAGSILQGVGNLFKGF